MDPCKVCQAITSVGDSYPDQVAQEKGYCGAGCESVDEQISKLTDRMAKQEGR
jgi:hypothetical protein